MTASAGTSPAAARPMAAFSLCWRRALTTWDGSLEILSGRRIPPATVMTCPSRSNCCISRRTVMCDTPSMSVSSAMLITPRPANLEAMKLCRSAGIIEALAMVLRSAHGLLGIEEETLLAEVARLQGQRDRAVHRADPGNAG